MLLRAPDRALVPDAKGSYSAFSGTYSSWFSHLPDTKHARFVNNYFTECAAVSEEGSYLRRIDFCITER